MSASLVRAPAVHPSAVEWAMLRALLVEALGRVGQPEPGDTTAFPQPLKVRFGVWYWQLRWSQGAGAPMLEISLWAGDTLLEHVRTAVAAHTWGPPPWHEQHVSQLNRGWLDRHSVG